MISYQERVLRRLEAITERQGLELVGVGSYANVGTLYAMEPGDWKVVARLNYDFQRDGALFLINGAKVGPPSTDVHHLTPLEHESAVRLFLRWAHLLREEDRA